MMYCFKKMGLLLLCVVGVCTTMHAELKYQQDLTIASWVSKEDVEKKAREFCDATIGDPDIKVVDVKYNTKKSGKLITYIAVITCYVSKTDEDFMRINGKIFQEQNKLVDTAVSQNAR